MCTVRMPIRRILLLLSLALVVASGGSALAAQDTTSYGVYVRLADSDRSLDEVVEQLRTDIAASPWDLITDYAAAVDDDDCRYQAHVFVVSGAEYATAVLEQGPTAAFALPLRLAVFTDELGTHIVAANPQSLNRTIIAETGFETASAEAVAALQALVEASFPDVPDETQYGQLRNRGLISKTMGMIAGGPFEDKVERIASV